MIRRLAHLKRLAVSACFVLAFAHCGSTTSESGVTSIRLVPRFDTSWRLNQLVLESRGRSATVPEEPAALESNAPITVLLRDDEAGKPMDVEVWGLAKGKRIAKGKVAVTPVRWQAVDAPVELALMTSCNTSCSPGTKTCSGDGVKECVREGEGDGEACSSWSDEVPCPTDTPYCSSGACAASCVDECAEDSAQCAGSGAFQRCGQADSDPCLDWMPETLCEGGTTCESGVCTAAPCADECAAEGDKACANGGTTTCGQYDADSCLDLGPRVACPSGQSCSNGECSETCSDECSTSTCTGNSWKQCGEYDLDPCLDLSAGTSCAATDACHVGACSAQGGCSVTPITCDSPPSMTCITATTLRTYAATGTCGASGCSYQPTDSVCPAPPNGAPKCESGFCGFVCNAGYQRSGSTCVPIVTPASWTTLTSGTFQSLHGVWGAGGKVWATGYGTANVVLHRSGAAATWTQSTLPSWPYGVWGTSATNVYIAGAQIFNSTSGTTWSTQTAPNNGRYGVWGSSATNIYAVGSYGSLVRTTGNGTWTAESPGTGNHLTAVWGSSATNVYVVGRQGTILHSTGNGTWTPQASGTTDDLNAIWGSGPNDIYVAGWGGRIMHSTGNGVWTSQNPINRSFYGVWGSSSTDVYVVGSEGTIFHSTGDDTWSPEASGTTQDLQAIWGSGPNDVYAVGDNGTIVHKP